MGGARSVDPAGAAGRDADGYRRTATAGCPVIVLRLALALAVIVVVAWLMGAAARRLGQPAVVGEIIGGILLGQTLFHGAVSSALFPATTRRPLADLATVGVCLFMFFVGMRTETSLLRGRLRATLSVSLVSIVVPFALGAGLAVVFHAQRPAGADPLAFVLFLGLALSITAFPVLARILADRGMRGTVVGEFALACAALGDVLGWTVLAVVGALATGRNDAWTVSLVVPLAVVLTGVLRPALARLASRHDVRGPIAGSIVLVCLGGTLAACAAATDAFGLHPIFGAFLLGTAMPRRGAQVLRETVLPRVERFGAVALLPVFFVSAGLGVDLSSFGAAALGGLALILAAAVGGKLIAGYAAARVNGFAPGDAATLAVLGNTRGLTELVVLTVGRQLGLLSTQLFSQMVVMAVVTTAMTGVLLQALSAGHVRPR